jgi:type I restriction enzyme R subunit
VFGRELHSYVITDAIRDEKVLKFKVDYNDVRPQFKAIETEQDEKKLSAAENKQALLHPDRIREITQYILNNFRQKTHRLQAATRASTPCLPSAAWMPPSCITSASRTCKRPATSR